MLQLLLCIIVVVILSLLLLLSLLLSITEMLAQSQILDIYKKIKKRLLWTTWPFRRSFQKIVVPEEEEEEEEVVAGVGEEDMAVSSDHALYAPKPTYDQLDQYR